MFTTPALLMSAKRKKESPFKDCWPLYNYSLKIIPELTDPVYAVTTTARKTMRVSRLEVLNKDGSISIEEKGTLVSRVPSVGNTYLMEMGKFYLAADEEYPAISTLLFNDGASVSDSFCAYIENDDLEAFCNWLSQSQGTTDPATLVDTYLAPYGQIGTIIKGFTFTASLGDKTKTVDVDYFSALRGDGKGAQVPDVEFMLLDEGGGAIACEIGIIAAFNLAVPVAANSYSDFYSNPGKCGEPFWDMLYESYETKSPVTIDVTLWLSPTACILE